MLSLVSQTIRAFAMRYIEWRQQQQAYAELGKQMGEDPKVLQTNLMNFALRLQQSTNATTYERANAAYVSQNYMEAARLALAVV